MAIVAVHCPRCQSAQVYRHGQNPKGRARRQRANHRNGVQRSRCPRYRKDTQNWNKYRHPHFKKLAPKRITSSPVAHADVALICESPMNSGALSAARPDSTGSGMPATPKQVVFLFIRSVHERMKPVVSCWLCSPRLISA